MKHFSYILFLLLSCFTACQRHTTYPPAMRQAEELMNTRPDSALTLLEGMSDTLVMLPEEMQMYHHLLTIQAKDKEYITHTSDSLINRIVTFYEELGNKERLMMAYYYQGSTYRDMNDAPRALKAFHQVVDLNVPDLDLLAKTYNQMGNLFMYQGLHDEVIRVNRKSIELYLLQGKRNKISYFQRDIARMYDVKNVPDSALHYYQEACQTALEDGDSMRYYGILGELGGYYYETGHLDKAKRALSVAEKESKRQNKTHIYIKLGNIYEEANQWDSAYHYYKKVLSSDNIYKKCNTYYNLGWMESRKGNHSQAMEYMKQHVLLRDSIDKIKETEAIAKINSLYNYQHTEADNIKLIDQQEQHRMYIAILELSILFLLATSFSVFFYLQKRKLKAILHEKKLKEFEMRKNEKSQVALEAILEEMQVVNKKLENKKKENVDLQNKVLLLEKELLNLHERQIRITQEKQKLNVQLLKDMDIYKRFHEASQANATTRISLDSSEWQELTDAINQTYPKFTERLSELYPMSPIELRVCCLIKICISPAGIARLVCRTRSNITLIRIRLYEKIHKKPGTSELFDKFIEEI